MPSTILTNLTHTLTSLPLYWHRLTTWCRAKKRAWLYTKPLQRLGPLGLTYPHLHAFYAYSYALLLITTFLPWTLLFSWYTVGVACTWQPWRQHLLQDLCFVPGFEAQHNASFWPIPRFHGAVGGGGLGENASRYLESVMVGPTALADQTIAVRQQRKKMEKSAYSKHSRLPGKLVEIEHALERFHPQFERFSLSLCHALDDIDHGFWVFIRDFDRYLASTDQHAPYISWTSLIFHPWSHVARLANSGFNTGYLPQYRPYSWRIEAEIIYEFNRFFLRSMKALDDIDRAFLARDFPSFVETLTSLLRTFTEIHTLDSSRFDWMRSEEFGKVPLLIQLAQKYLGVEPQALEPLNEHRRLYDRNGHKLSDIENALETWATYLAQLRQQILSMRHLFQRRTSVVDLLLQRPGSGVKPLMLELRELGRERYVKEAAGRFTNVVEFNMQIGRLHDMIVGVSSGFENGTCVAKMGRARQKWQKEMGVDAETVIMKLLKFHEDHKKGKPMPEYW